MWHPVKHNLNIITTSEPGTSTQPQATPSHCNSPYHVATATQGGHTPDTNTQSLTTCVTTGNKEMDASLHKLIALPSARAGRAAGQLSLLMLCACPNHACDDCREERNQQ